MPRIHVLALAFSLMAVSPVSASEDAKLEAFFKEHLEASFVMRPLDATRLGDHRFDHLLDDVSAPARAAWLAHDRDRLLALPRTVSYEKLSRDGQIDYEILRAELERNIWLAENTRPFEEDPRVYGDTVIDSVYALLTQSTLPREVNLKNAIARMKVIPAVLAEARAALSRPPRSVLETAIRQNRGSIAFFEQGIFELVGESPQRPALERAVAPVVVALKAHQRFLEEELLPRATDSWRLGKEKFAKKLELVLDAGLSADQVLADAEAEYIRVVNDMYVVSRDLWSRYFPRQALPPDDSQGRRSTIAQVVAAASQEHSRPDELVSDARASVGRIRAFIAEHDILRLPEPDRCQVLEMPEFKRGNSLAYLESALPLDPSGKGTYAVSPPLADWPASRVKSFLEEYNRHMLQMLTIHEAYPGHYVQLEYSNRVPSLIRKVLQSGVFIEGWAVYTEQMMLDQGYGEREPALRLNQLKYYLRAVANAILDHKMHAGTMTDEQAMELLVNGAFQSEGEAHLKVIRAKQSSVQLSTYFVGRMAHYRLRQQTQREMGEAFELGRFHEAVLSHGSVPMKFLPELVRRRLQQPR